MGRELGYGMRISVYDRFGRYDGIVNLSENVAKMFEKPYVEIRRMQDRLAFVPWDKKTGKGLYLINNAKIQFSQQFDCEKALDFCGEWEEDMVAKTDNGVVFVKLGDMKPFSKSFSKKHAGHVQTQPEEETPKKEKKHEPSQSLIDLLGAAIEKTKKDLKHEDEIIETLKEELDKATKRRENVNRELLAYFNAYNAAKGCGFNEGSD